MSSVMRSMADAVKMKKNQGENTVKRTFAKLRHPMRAKVSDSAFQMSYEHRSHPHEEPHITTGEYATSAGHAIIKEFAKYLQGDEGEAALRKIFICQARVVYDLALELLLSDELKAASLMAGREIVSGSSDGMESKLNAQIKKLPKFVKVSIFSVIGIFGGLFVLGLLLALWRFALFGLSQ